MIHWQANLFSDAADTLMSLTAPPAGAGAAAPAPLDVFAVVRKLPVAREGDLQLEVGDIVVRVGDALERSRGCEQWSLGYKAKDSSREVKLFRTALSGIGVCVQKLGLAADDVALLTESTVNGLTAVDASATDVTGTPTEMVLCNDDGSEKHRRHFSVDANSRTLRWAKKPSGSGKQRQLTGCTQLACERRLTFETSEGQVCAIAGSPSVARAWGKAVEALLDSDLDAYTVVSAPRPEDFREGEDLQLVVGDTIVLVGPAPSWSSGYVLGREPREVKPFPTGPASYVHQIGPEDICELTTAQLDGLSTVDTAELTVVQPEEGGPEPQQHELTVVQPEEGGAEPQQHELTNSLSGAQLLSMLRLTQTLPGLPNSSDEEGEDEEANEHAGAEPEPEPEPEQPSLSPRRSRDQADDSPPLISDLRVAEKVVDVINVDAKENKQPNLALPSPAVTPTNSFAELNPPGDAPGLEPQPRPVEAPLASEQLVVHPEEPEPLVVHVQPSGTGEFQELQLESVYPDANFVPPGRTLTLRRADMTGAKVSSPNTSRPGHAVAIRVDLKTADNQGDKKYIISASNSADLARLKAALTPQSRGAPVSREGPMEKQGEGLDSAFKPRYFKLEGSGLEYFERSDSRSAKGSLDMTTAVYVQRPGTWSWQSSRVKKEWTRYSPYMCGKLERAYLEAKSDDTDLMHNSVNFDDRHYIDMRQMCQVVRDEPANTREVRRQEGTEIEVKALKAGSQRSGQFEREWRIWRFRCTGTNADAVAAAAAWEDSLRLAMDATECAVISSGVTVEVGGDGQQPCSVQPDEAGLMHLGVVQAPHGAVRYQLCDFQDVASVTEMLYGGKYIINAKVTHQNRVAPTGDQRDTPSTLILRFDESCDRDRVLVAIARATDTSAPPVRQSLGERLSGSADGVHQSADSLRQSAGGVAGAAASLAKVAGIVEGVPPLSRRSGGGAVMSRAGSTPQ